MSFSPERPVDLKPLNQKQLGWRVRTRSSDSQTTYRNCSDSQPVTSFTCAPRCTSESVYLASKAWWSHFPAVTLHRGVDPVATLGEGNFKALTESGRPWNCHYRLSILNSSVTNRNPARKWGGFILGHKTHTYLLTYLLTYFLRTTWGWKLTDRKDMKHVQDWLYNHWHEVAKFIIWVRSSPSFIQCVNVDVQASAFVRSWRYRNGRIMMIIIIALWHFTPLGIKIIII